MARLLALLSLAYAVMTTATAIPTKTLRLHRLNSFIIFAPTLPWHHRPLVTLPSSHDLGLENFTVVPGTQPLTFLVFPLNNGNFALRFSSPGAEPTKGLYLTALARTSTSTAFMKLMDISTASSADVTDAAAMLPNECPKGYECTANQWIFTAKGGIGASPDLGFVGFEGKWMPCQEAEADGWRVYWKDSSRSKPNATVDQLPWRS